MTLDYFYSNQSDQFTFYRIPKALFTHPELKYISTEAKVLYGLLLDRMSLSAKNNWVDDSGRVFIIFTIQEVMESLDCAEHKAVNLMNELEKKVKLIERKRQGLGKPNLIYVKNFVDKSVKPVRTYTESQLLNCENSNSGNAIITGQEIPESQSNNTEINNKGFKNIRHFVDDGYSGTTFNRPGFNQLIAEVEAGHVGTIIVKDMSRFGRNYLQVGFYTEIQFPQKGVRFIAINNGVDSDNPTENDFTPFLNIMNEWYAKDTSNKIKAVFKQRMSNGLRCSGSIPYGYRREPGDKQTLYIDEEAAAVVRRIFNMAADGASMGAIAEALTKDKVLIPSAYLRYPLAVVVLRIIGQQPLFLFHITFIKLPGDYAYYSGETTK